MTGPDELRHLRDGPGPGERAGGAGVVTVTAVADDPAAVLDRVRAVVTAVVENAGPPWPEVGQWQHLLPAWFVAATPPATAPRAASPGVADEWSLEGWLTWLEPDQREWHWWDGRVAAPDRLVVDVVVPGWPAPLGALVWLLTAAGAGRVDYD